VGDGCQRMLRVDPDTPARVGESTSPTRELKPTERGLYRVSIALPPACVTIMRF
jgi:hypothetical protein